MTESPRKTILLVEDTRELAHVVARELDAAGYRVVRAGDGQTALEAHAWERPDLVVLDWMLPRLSGIDVLREVRRSSATPVLMLTAGGEAADRVIGLELGADDYLPKPFGMRGWPRVRVAWVGDSQHNVAGDGFESPVQKQGELAHTFTDPGTYDYRCTLHGEMNGEVIVTG